MNTSPRLWERLGSLFNYPRDAGYGDRLRECRLELEALLPAAAAELEAVENALAPKEPWEIEELYTRAFDMNPVCALEIGWHLYGEQYERGRFLVRARELLAHLSIAEDGELPDHLSLMLIAMGRLDVKDKAPFAARFLVPALREMRSAIAGGSSPFAGLISAATMLAVVEAKDVPIARIQRRPDLVQLGGRPKRAANARPMP